MRPGLDYDQRNISTFTADRSTQRLLLALHATYSTLIEHFYIKSAYLHEKYEHVKPIYVKQMPKFDGTFRHNSTCGRLKGNLYDLLAAKYYYNKGLKTFLSKRGYHHTEHDPCLYVKHMTKGTILVSTTIDDFLVSASNQTLIDDLYSELFTKYRIKRLGTPRRFLNWTIKLHEDGSVHMSPTDALDAIIQQTRMTDCNPTRTPYTSLTQNDTEHTYETLSPQRVTRYRQVPGEIRYITDSTRPDIAYITNKLAQHMKQPTTQQERALKALLRYLKGTRTHGLLYSIPKSKATKGQPLKVYSDADFANEENRRSISGNVQYI